jgi:YbbR domain-containing protein
VNRAGETLTNVATFLLALVLAFFIWMSASETQDPIRTRFLEVPLQYVGLPADTTLVDVDARQTVQIRLEGPDTILQEITPDDFVATADLSQVPSGERVSVEINVTTTNIRRRDFVHHAGAGGRHAGTAGDARYSRRA